MNKEILVAAAWPYANGSLHLGHVAALLGAVIIARYYRLCGNDVLFVSGSDCHGTPIVVEANHQGIHPSKIAEKYHREFIKTLIDGLNFSYDLYTKTTTENHKKVVQEIFLKLYRNEYIYTKTEKLPYCLACKRFLPDRYIEGECPICHFLNARGDQCDECGNLLDSHQLLNPRCKICGQTPEWRSSEHFFFRLSAFQEQIKEWVSKSKDWRINAKNFTLNLLEQGLHDRAITRDTEWGIPIPLPGYEGKSIYVWFEAVCGYLSASKEWAQLQNQENLWQKFWLDNSLIHFYIHGKDNIPFHTIIWPAILFAYGGLHLPDRIISSEYLTLEKKQFSKSRNWAVWLPDFLAQFDPETLRYFLIANGPETADADFSWSEFRIKTNSELIGNFGNFIHRTLSFVKVNFPDGVGLPEKLEKEGAKFLALTKESFISVGRAIERGRFREGLQTILRLAEHGNRYINDISPWTEIKIDRLQTKRDLAVATNVIRNLAILISPYLPTTAERILNMIGLDIKDIRWEYENPGSLTISNLQPLYKRIESADVEKQRSRLGKSQQDS